MSAFSLRSRRLVLRDFEPADLDDVARLVGDDRVTRWLSYDSKSRDQAAQMIAGAIQRRASEPRTEYYLGIELDNTVIGFCRLGLDGVQAAKLGYAVGPDHQGNGYATEAARTLVDYGFDALPVHRVSAAIGPDNLASVAIAKTLGMTYEGRIRDHVYTNQAWRDSLLYSILQPEWNPAIDQ